MAKKIYCNICGKKFNEWDAQQRFGCFGPIGYGSKHDTEFLDLDICIDCMDKIIDACAISPTVDMEMENGL